MKNKLKVRRKVRESVINQLIIECEDPDLKANYESCKESILVNSNNLKFVNEEWVTLLANDIVELQKLIEEYKSKNLLSEKIILMAYATLVYFERDDDVIPDYSLLFRGLKDDAVAITYVTSIIKKNYPELAGEFDFSDGIVSEIE